MKDKEKQIEEISKILDLYSGCSSYNKAYNIANALYLQGYRKLPKDSVVLSREEFKKLLDNNIRIDMEYFEQEKAKARKETAEKIFEKIKNKINELEKFYFDNGKIGYNGLTIRELNELARQFGVEIKE